MKITLYTTDEKCTEIGVFESANICMFDEDMRISITFIKEEQQLDFITCCIKHYVLIQVQGNVVTLMPEKYQRVRFRFDSK